MATIKQVLAAISQDGTLGPNQKRFVTEAIQRAETWCQLQAGPKPRKISNAVGLMTIAEWDERQNWKKVRPHLREWVAQNNLDPDMVEQLLNEFVGEMYAKGKKYANFYAAFQLYLRKGYLSKPMSACIRKQHTHFENKGVNL